MALTWTEIQSITNDYFKTGEAVDIYFTNSFFMDWYMNKKKGLFERPTGGHRIRVPLEYAEQESAFFGRGGTLSSNDVETINAAYFLWKHVYGNATILMADELENASEYAEVQLVVQKAAGAQKAARKRIASNIYNGAGDGADEVTGLLSLTSETTTTAYGGIQESDMSKWEGKTDTTPEAISLDVIRDLRSEAKVHDGPDGKPDVCLTTEALFNIIMARLQVQQRFQTNDEVRAGFVHAFFEGATLAVDDFCPSGYMFCLNSKYIGFAIHKNGYFVRYPWADLVPSNIPAKSMKIFWHGNIICSHRAAHIAHSNLS